jgi:hypothetical protein
MPPRKPRRGRTQALFIVSLVALVFGAAEGLGALALWIHVGEAPSLGALRAEREHTGLLCALKAKNRGRLQVIHPYVGYVESPESNNPGLLADMEGLQVNELGLMGDRPPIERSRDEVVVGITGGSVALFLSIKGAAALEEKLHSFPAFRNKKIRIVRLALGGYKEPQQLMLLTYLLSLGSHFDVLINIDGFNELVLPVSEYLGAGLNPAYPRSWPEFAVGMDLGPRTIRVARLLEAKDRRCAWVNRMNYFPLRSSYFANAIWKMLDDQSGPALDAERREIFRVDWGSFPYFLTGPRLGLRTPTEMISAVVPIWEQSSIQLSRLCKANGIRYFHFLQPNQYIVGSKPMGKEEARVAIKKDTTQSYGPAAALGYPFLQEAGPRLRRAGVSFTDLTRIFANHPEPLYVDDCCHVDKHGNELLAEAIGQVVGQGF